MLVSQSCFIDTMEVTHALVSCTRNLHKGDICSKFNSCILFGASFWYQKKICTRKHGATQEKMDSEKFVGSSSSRCCCCCCFYHCLLLVFSLLSLSSLSSLPSSEFNLFNVEIPQTCTAWFCQHLLSDWLEILPFPYCSVSNWLQYVVARLCWILALEWTTVTGVHWHLCTCVPVTIPAARVWTYCFTTTRLSASLIVPDVPNCIRYHELSWQPAYLSSTQ